MDSAGSSPATGSLIFGAVIFLLFACYPLLASAPDRPPQSDQITTTAQQLFREERWQEIVRLAEVAPKRSAELEYLFGVALAHLERWDEARKALWSGSRMQPDDKRFPIELAGVAFKQKKYSEAAAQLRHALRLDSSDSYATGFLATVYFLQGNLEAALKYWNRVGKTEVEQARVEPLPRVDPVLLDHAFAFSPASTLHLADLLSTEARIRGLEIFPDYRLELLARTDGKFDTVFHVQERDGWGHGKVESLLRFFRGLPYQQVDPEYFNLKRSAINIVSLVRWDAQKRRLLASISAPFHRDPKWHYRLGMDLRNEKWEIRDSFSGPALLRGGLNMRREELNAGITRFVGARWSWSSTAHLSRRDYRNVYPGTALTPQLLAKGYELKQTAQVNYDLWRVPEKRFTVGSGVSSQVGRLWSKFAGSFAKLQASLEPHWFPQARGDDYETKWRIQSGKTFGLIPFDELFTLGSERDNDLWLRGHIGTRDGRKGSAPLGRNYFLSNWETDKNVYKNGLFTLKLGPFLDTGEITDSSSALGSKKWLWDIGVQAKVCVLAICGAFSYGKDLRSGNNAFYTMVAR